MHVTTHSTNINFTVPTSSPNNISSNTNSANQRQVVGDQQQQYQLQSHQSTAQHGSTSCDTEDEIPASVISSVGTVNYQQSAHQILFVSTASRFTAPPNHEIAQPNQQHRPAIAPNATFSGPSSPIGKMVHSQQHINVSAANQQQPPRQHPKKRKFNPSELEEMAPTTTATTAQPTQTSSSVTPTAITHSNGNGTGNGAPQINNTQQQSIEPVYTFATVPAKMMSLASVIEDGYKTVTTTCANSSPATTMTQHPTQPLYPLCLLVSAPPQSTKPEQPAAVDTLDLTFFYSHRVLARMSDYYAAGALEASEIPNSVVVKFDGRGQQIYYDVFDSGRNDVISDACPTANDVCILYYGFFNICLEVKVSRIWKNFSYPTVQTLLFMLVSKILRTKILFIKTNPTKC